MQYFNLERGSYVPNTPPQRTQSLRRITGQLYTGPAPRNAAYAGMWFDRAAQAEQQALDNRPVRPPLQPRSLDFSETDTTGTVLNNSHADHAEDSTNSHIEVDHHNAGNLGFGA